MENGTEPNISPTPGLGTDDAQEVTPDQLAQILEELCRSKAEEFRMLGYEHVTGKEIWSCVNERYHKEGIPPLHRVVNDILSLKATQFMNFITLSAFKGTHFN